MKYIYIYISSTHTDSMEFPDSLSPLSLADPPNYI